MPLPGKTLFLIYSLVRRLGEKQAVALQFLDGTYFYALFKDTVTVHSLDDALPLYECPTLWALCDSNDDVESPDSIFKRQRGRFRIIQTTPPRASRYKEWSKQVGAMPYLMDIWSDEELVYLA
jgi:hypothetical protein